MLLSGLPREWTHQDYGPATWSPHEIVGHLIFGERTDWIPRARIILQYSETRAFDPFDRQGHASLCRDRTLDELLDLFALEREASLGVLRGFNLNQETLRRTGIHPALGKVTLSQLLATWVVHDLNHVAQVCRALAYQHHSEVGPWAAYLSILAPPAPR